jgi:hypothetical protein
MIMVSANETFKKILNPSGEMNVSAYITSGAAAGALVRNSLCSAGSIVHTYDVVCDRDRLAY